MIDWITISQDSGSGNAIITVTADTYSGLVERTASLKVSTVSNRITRYVTLIQNAENPFTVTPSVITIAGTGGTYSIDIQSDYGWTATTIPAWITLSSSSGSSGMLITASAGVHTGNARTGSIIFTDAKGRTATVNLTQGIISVPTPPDNAIYYTVNDGEIPSFSWFTEGWGANITAEHVLQSGGYYAVFFDAPIYWVPGWYEYLGYNRKATNGNNNINGIWFPKSIETIGGCAFLHAGGIKKVVFPSNSNLKELKTSAFDSAGVEEVVFGDNTPFVIGYCAFNNNDLTSIHIGVTTRELGGAAFAHNSLSSITFDSVTEPFYDEVNGSTGPFYDNPSGGTLHLPSGASYTEIFNTGDLHPSWTSVNDHDVPSVAADYVWPAVSHDMGTTWHAFYFGSSGFTYDTTEYTSSPSRVSSGTCGNGYCIYLTSTYNVDENSAHTFTISNAQTAATVERGCRPAYPANNSEWTVNNKDIWGTTYPSIRTLQSKRFAFNLYNKVVNYNDYTVYNFNFEARKWELFAEDNNDDTTTWRRTVYAKYKVIMENGQSYEYPDLYSYNENPGLKINVR